MQWACEFRIQTFQSTVNSPNFSVNHVNSTKCDVVDVVLMGKLLPLFGVNPETRIVGMLINVFNVE